MKYFGIYNNSGDVQTALNESALTKPYVAMVSGSLDYNTIGTAPTPTARTGVWIEVSDGNEYSGTPDGNSYRWKFTKDEAATWTLYEDGNVVTPKWFVGDFGVTCEDNTDPDWIGDQVQEQNYAVEDIDIGANQGLEPGTIVDVSVDYYTGADSTVGVYIIAEDCDIYWGEEQRKCEEEQGGCWDVETNSCGDCPTCEDQGLCDDGEGNCVECQSCEDQGLCDDGEGNCVECESGCDGDPECECNEQGGCWDGENCNECEE